MWNPLHSILHTSEYRGKYAEAVGQFDIYTIASS